MKSATVKFFNGRFGFLAPQDGSSDVFVSASTLGRTGINTLVAGDIVRIEVSEDRAGRGPFAKRIEHVKAAA
jgi:cold shock protein